MSYQEMYEYLKKTMLHLDINCGKVTHGMRGLSARALDSKGIHEKVRNKYPCQSADAQSSALMCVICLWCHRELHALAFTSLHAFGCSSSHHMQLLTFFCICTVLQHFQAASGHAGLTDFLASMHRMALQLDMYRWHAEHPTTRPLD